MSQHPLYGLLYIVLLPFALLFGLSALSNLILGTQAPALFLVAFLAACYSIYTIATLVFYVKGIQQQRPCKPSLRDWIRVNAFVIVAPTFLFLVNGIAILLKPSLIQGILSQYQEIQGGGFALSAGFIRAMIYVLLVYTGVLFVHIIYTFRLLKNYKAVFGLGSRSNDL
jgi:hypothetical protein